MHSNLFQLLYWRVWGWLFGEWPVRMCLTAHAPQDSRTDATDVIGLFLEKDSREEIEEIKHLDAVVETIDGLWAAGSGARMIIRDNVGLLYGGPDVTEYTCGSRTWEDPGNVPAGVLLDRVKIKNLFWVNESRIDEITSTALGQGSE